MLSASIEKIARRADGALVVWLVTVVFDGGSGRWLVVVQGGVCLGWDGMVLRQKRERRWASMDIWHSFRFYFSYGGARVVCIRF